MSRLVLIRNRSLCHVQELCSTWIRCKSNGRRSSSGSTSKAYNDFALKRENRYMKRTVDILSNHTNVTKKPWNYLGPMGAMTGVSSKSMGRVSERRADQLSIVFGDRIRSLFESGEVCAQLLDDGFEVAQVRMSADSGLLNVYWLASGDAEKDKRIVDLLPRAALELRSALAELRMTGVVPGILFVKDESVARQQEVERLLNLADMGPRNPVVEVDDDSQKLEASIEVSRRPKLTNKFSQKISNRRLQESVSELTKNFQMQEISGLRRADGVVEVSRSDTVHDGNLTTEELSEAHTGTVSACTSTNSDLLMSNLLTDSNDIELKKTTGINKSKECTLLSGEQSGAGKHLVRGTVDAPVAASCASSTAVQSNRTKHYKQKQVKSFRNSDSILSSHYHKDAE